MIQMWSKTKKNVNYIAPKGQLFAKVNVYSLLIDVNLVFKKYILIFFNAACIVKNEKECELYCTKGA